MHERKEIPELIFLVQHCMYKVITDAITQDFGFQLTYDESYDADIIWHDINV